MSKQKATSSKPRRSSIAKRNRAAAQKAKGAPTTKTQACLDLLSRASGATVAEMQKATGWQRHSVRGFLSGQVKKKLGLNIGSTKEQRGRVYRIDRAPAKGAA